ncbi:hypothetical protein K0I73_08685 [Shewanella mesophila]|uniref:hypothetical protein n=1 Tax=Shewanella mesophila TaxID=2864208 RepID=UPI001C659E47|nr:hypothetical protein [Shewanella mesophila]QYJ87736.1 hypothetical protein K0I73_08685 [Shewanella mesophila]
MPIRIVSGFNFNGLKRRSNLVEPSFDRTFSLYSDNPILANHNYDRRLVDHNMGHCFSGHLSFFAVVLTHVLLLWCLQLAWRPSLNTAHLEATVETSHPKTKKVNAYIIYQPATPLRDDSIEPSIAEAPVQVTEKSKSQRLIQADTQIEALATNKTVKQAPITSESAISADNKLSLRVKKNSNQSQTANNSVIQTNRPAVNVSQFTQGYVERQRLAALDSLVVNEANLYTQNRSLSEMDGDMEILQLSTPDEFTTAVTLDSHIDPNRIVKQGDTCYRIVKVGTVLNPHAENLGYPFKCGGQTIEQALKAAIDKRLAMMGVKN